MNELSYVPLSRPRPPKGVTARARAKRKRAEGPRLKQVRAEDTLRDGYCRVGKDMDDYSDCQGPSELCHFGASKRARTRGMAPERRHTTAGSFKGCRAHHADYDQGRLRITASSDRGCDGPLVYQWEQE